MAEVEEHVNVSDDDDSDNYCHTPELQGNLSKWTNYIHGWQSRFIVLKDGTLSYYKSEEETGFGCRGAISLLKATIKPHEFDECRFDVSVNDCVWYLRADTPEDKQYWVDILEAFKADSGYGSENSLKRHGSALSLTSNNLSSASASSFKKGKGLKEKLAEMETYKDILSGQMETLQSYFDSCAEAVLLKKNQGELVTEHALKAVDFKGEAMTFKATAGAVLSTLQFCLEAVGQREDIWRRRLDKEIERRKKLEDLYRNVKQQAGGIVVMHGSPDEEEGPHSTLNEDEFYDAVETGLDKLEEEAALRERLKYPTYVPKPSSKAAQHKLWPEISKVTFEQIHYATLGLGEGGWQLFAEDGEMKMYRREEEINGLVMDPLKACHVVKGVTGHEMCHYFFKPEYRHEWEATVEQMKVLETIGDDTLLFLQVHKRIWPASQRDALFWSHMTQVPNINDKDANNIWVVVNHSTEAPEYPAKSKGCVRILLSVCLMCQTLVTPPTDGSEITRDDITCKITYCSTVNPGGWVPASALRALYKREYPKFLKRFTSYVISQTKNKPIMF
uniref:Ceramide transfer protein n=1 Tax=Clastoptera arizonana TaxID=38151 RepID=A0A1B6ECM8_9HEMI